MGQICGSNLYQLLRRQSLGKSWYEASPGKINKTLSQQMSKKEMVLDAQV
jgi:hypothetical protein